MTTVEMAEDARETHGSLSRSDAQLAVLIGVGTVCVYFALPERIYDFDGVLFAGFLKVIVGMEDRASFLFSFPKHYLYLPTIYVIVRGVQDLFPGPVEIYRVMQIVSSVLFAGTNAFAYLVFRRFGVARVACVAGALLWAFTRTHWGRAVEGQVYPVGHFFALSAVLLASTTPLPVSGRRLAGLIALTALAVLFHVSHVILVIPVVGAWWIGRGREALGPSARYVLGSAIAAGLPPIIHHRLYDPDELRRWFLLSTNSTEYFASGFFTVPSLRDFYDDGIHILLRSFVAIEGAGPVAGIGKLAIVALLILVVLSAYRILRADRRIRTAATLWTLVFVVYGVFFVVATPGFIHFWEMQCAAVVAVIVLGLPRSQAPGTTALLVVVVATIFTVNLIGRMIPASRADFNPAAIAAARMRTLTPPDATLLFSGGGAGDNDLKAYALYFAERNWLSLDMRLASLPAAERCADIREVLAAEVERRGVLFASRRVVASDGTGRTFREFGCSLEDATRALAEYSCVVVEDADPLGLLILFKDGSHPEVLAAREHLVAIGRSDLAVRVADPSAHFACDQELSKSGAPGAIQR